LEEQVADGFNKRYFDRWARMLQLSPFKAYYRRVGKEYERKFREHGYSLASPTSKTPVSLDEYKPDHGILTPLLYLGADIFFAVWRAGRWLRIRVQNAAVIMRSASVAKKSDRGGQFMGRLRILLLGPDSSPEQVSMPYVTYSHAAALAQLHDVTLVARSSVEDALLRAKAPFRAIEVVRMPLLDRIYAWSLRKIFKYNYDTQVLTAFGYPFSVAFEWCAWRQLRRRIFASEFDVVLRLLPMTPVLPSPFAFFLRKGPIPFVIGPLNGGLPWPPGFSQLEKQKEWASRLRNLYRYLPFAGSTYRHATAILAASSQTYAEFAAYGDKLFFVPEPGIGRSLCFGDSRNPKCGAKLELIFVGGLVPRKACDLALRGAAPILRSDLAHFTVVGDGPERSHLEQLTRSLGIESAVSFCGWLSHVDVLRRLRSADMFVFPSLRDNGAGVVFEALGSGAVPVVADFGGPGDIVHPEVGRKVSLTNESDMVSQITKIVTDLAEDRDLLDRLRQQGMAYARERLTWDAKAQSTTKVLNWAVRRGPKPNLPPPKMLQLARASRS
jgi:glycosyltransferase involved in cell wall biosynthesis